MRQGNSLIQHSLSPEDKSFNWKNEFPEIFKDGGFDIIIGNPPYVRQEELSKLKPYLEANYETYHSMADLFVYFFEKEIGLLKDGGYLGLIISNKWLKAGYALKLRKLLSKYWIEQFIDFGDLKVFPDATTYPCIVILRKVAKENPNIRVCLINDLAFDSLGNYIKQNGFTFDQRQLEDNSWNFQNNKISKILKKIYASSTPLKEYTKDQVYRGILTGLTEAFVIDKETRDSIIKKDRKSAEIIRPFLTGKEARRYGIQFRDNYIILTKVGVDIDRYPGVVQWLTKYKSQLEKRWDKGNYWYELRACDYYDLFEKPKIIYGKITTQPRFTIDTEGYLVNDSNFFIPVVDKSLLAILNSKLGWFLIMNTCTQVQGGYQLIWKYFGNVPISNKKSDELEKMVDKMLVLNNRLAEIGNKQTDERMHIEEQIKKTDNEINGLVYKLYDITEEEKMTIEERME